MFSFHSTDTSRQYRTALCWTSIRATRATWAHGFFKSKTEKMVRLNTVTFPWQTKRKSQIYFQARKVLAFHFFPAYKLIYQNPRDMFCTPELNHRALNYIFKPPWKNWEGKQSPLLQLAHILFLVLYRNPAYPTEIRAMLLCTLYIHNAFKAVAASESMLFNKAVETHRKENRNKERQHLQTHRIAHLYSG